MDSKDEKDDRMNEQQPEDESSDKEIPLWLQGLTNDELEEPKPFASKEDVKDSWVPEIEETIEDDQVDDEEIINLPVEPLDPGFHDQTTDERENMESEPTEEIQIDELPNIKYSDDIGPSLDDLPSSEGFMDISTIDFSEVQKKVEPNIEDEALIEGDLPEWLQEMIAENEKPNTGETELENLEEQDIVDDQAPVQDLLNLDQIPSQDDPIEEEELVVDDDLGVVDIMNIEEDEPAPDSEDLVLLEPSSHLEETAIAIAEDETSPVVISKGDDLKLPLSQEEPIAEELNIVAEDEQLGRAKLHLDQGEFDQALPIINKLLEESIHLENLEMWIQEATENDEKTNSKVWELLGDITFRQDKPGEAFYAYAKAIKLLLKSDEVTDETR